MWVYPVREFTSSRSEDSLYEMYYGDKYICEAINNGFPLNCVVSTDVFLKTSLETYKKSVLISPIPQTEEIKQRLKEFENHGGKIIYYGSEKAAQKSGITENFVNIASAPSAIREKLADFGYSIKFDRKSDGVKPNALTISRVDNSLTVSVYSPNLTTDTLLKFPLGAPVLTGTDTEIRDGHAVYRFGMSEHKECRVFVKQDGGVVSLKEFAPVSLSYHRKLKISGLKNAEICIMPESGGEVYLSSSMEDSAVKTVDCLKRVEDRENGVYYKGENISGTFIVLLKKY